MTSWEEFLAVQNGIVFKAIFFKGKKKMNLRNPHSICLLEGEIVS